MVRLPAAYRQRGISALVGAQFGSEGKGALTAHLAAHFGVHVRVGAANAGHTFYVEGQRHVLRQLPVAAYANPEATLAIGPGALLSEAVLREEIAANRAWRQQRDLAPLQLLVDGRAQVIAAEHVACEQASDLEQRIGSTSARASEGIGAAQAARVMRDRSCQPVSEHALAAELQLIDVAQWLAADDQRRRGVLLEGTQGTGLSLPTGAFPYVTSRNVTASGLAADCGLGPRAIDEVIMVCRAHPIRVASPPGQTSGPFAADSQEISWHQLGVAAEHTTVTGTERRVATLSLSQLTEAARLNTATALALMFCDYVDPAIAGRTQSLDARTCAAQYPQLAAMIAQIESATGVEIRWLGTGPQTVCMKVTEVFSSTE